jgi:uncharacterized protein involved in cysteine biosynthesis
MYTATSTAIGAWLPKPSEVHITSCVPQILDLELQDFMFSLLGFGFAFVLLLLSITPIHPFWNEDVHSVPL